MKVWKVMSKATTLSAISVTCGYYPLDNDELSQF